MSEIKTVGVVGFGVMGAAIALNAAGAGYQVIYKELNDELVAAMFERWVTKPLSKRVAQGKMSQGEMDELSGRISGTSLYSGLRECDLVIEAAIEKMDLKIEVFTELSKACRQDAILVSNTSTFLIEKLMAKVDNPGRTAGLHYFFPANINRLVEVIRQKKTSDDTYHALMEFARRNRKVAITVKDFPGFAVNPVFIASYVVLDSFHGDKFNAISLESISQETLGLKFGIMWVQNGAGLGTCYHAGVSMAAYLRAADTGYPAMCPQLKSQFESGRPWDIESGVIIEDSAARTEVRERLLGAIFAISTHLIEHEVVSPDDLELGIITSLAWPKGPLTLMNELGMEESSRLVKLAVAAGDFNLPQKFADNDLSPWKLKK
ncbi:MAG TPA: 3-hydroxyacyl-CoA dehydrogenase family protein [Proteobacteria bacterium]|nr:3-hydroxyacyl-CoA dehydrogenase family protein [Pseudomonadota bacterium]